MKRELYRRILSTVMGCFSTKVMPGNNSSSEKDLNQGKNDGKVLHGDISLRYEARRARQQRLWQKQQRITSAAEELTGRVMEERERLSLGSRSRATSHTASRADSPTQHKKHVTFHTISDASSGSHMSHVALVTDSHVGPAKQDGSLVAR